MKTWFAAVFSVILAVAIGSYVLIVVSSLSGSRGSVKQETFLECPSPDSRYTARFYREFGGGAAGWQYMHVTVRESGTSTSSVVLTLNRGYDVTLTWREDATLLIGYPDSARVDHWQSWFGRMGEGRTELTVIPSRSGSFLHSKAACG
jgi:hypothetical protein